MKRILTTLLLISALLLTVAAQENKPELGTLMLNKDFSPTALEAGEQLYYPVLLHCDTAQISRLFRQWNQYVDKHPQDEAAWRNFYEVYEAYYLRSFNALGGRTKQELAQQTNLQERLARGIPYTYTYDIIALPMHSNAFPTTPAPPTCNCSSARSIRRATRQTWSNC